ncbi:MAG: ATP-binding cassette domain-containing protein [Proteobacteria bacterium]|nr:ATP-binding cassette domain-containing protein [Pseudomonadota bacterium]
MKPLQVIVRSKHFSGRPILRNIAFDIRAGEVACVLAPSGAGKTTLLHIVAGLDSAFEGSVPGASLARGMVFQEPRLMPWLTLRGNLRLACRNATQLARIEHWMALANLTRAAENYPYALSTGMQRRAAIARAMIARPELLLLDEAFASLDEPMANTMRGAVLDAAKQSNATVLMATHDLREALACADRVLFLSESPARVLLDISPALNARGDTANPEVRKYCDTLQREYPRLLEGVLDDAVCEQQAT